MTSMPPPGPARDEYGAWEIDGGRVEPVRRDADGTVKRLRQAAAALSCLVIGLVLLSFFGSASGPSLDPIAEAASKTTSYPSYSTTFSGSLAFTDPAGGGSRQLQFTGTGVHNGTAHIDRLVTRVQGVDVAGTGPGKFIAIDDAALGDEFERSQTIDDQLPVGSVWLGHYGRADNAKKLSDQENPDALLRVLKATSTGSKAVGHEPVDGISTTHYRGTIDPKRYAAQLRSEGEKHATRKVRREFKRSGGVPTVDVWIDDTGLIRRMTMAGPTKDFGPGSHFTLRADFLDFGSAPEISVPPPTQVYDPAAHGRRILHHVLAVNAAGGGPGLRLGHGPALSRSSYVARANRVCAVSYARQHPLDKVFRHLSRTTRTALLAAVKGSPRSRELLPGLQTALLLRAAELQRLDITEMHALAGLRPPASIRVPATQAVAIANLMVRDWPAARLALADGHFYQLDWLAVQEAPLRRAYDRISRRIGLHTCTKHP